MNYIFISIILSVFNTCLTIQTEKPKFKSKEIDSSKNSINKRLNIKDDYLINLYINSIENFVDIIKKKDTTHFNTLFFIKNKTELLYSIPNNKLPNIIKKTKIKFLTQEQADNNKHMYTKFSPCINLISDIEKDSAQIIFIVFYPQYQHKYDCYLNYKINTINKNYTLENFTIKVLEYNHKEKATHFSVFKNGKYVGTNPIN